MSVLVSVLSPPVVAAVPIDYTFALAVSRVTGGEVTTDEVEPEWLDWAMEEIERRTNSCIRIRDFIDELHGNGLATVFTRCFPLIAVSKVTVEGFDLPESAYVVNLRTGSITLRTGLRRYGSAWIPFESTLKVNIDRFPPGLNNVVVTGIAGYQQLPSLIQKIAVLLVAKTALMAKNGPLIDHESIGDFSQTKSFKKINDDLDRAWAVWGTRFPTDLV